jgi:hypothetical protein
MLKMLDSTKKTHLRQTRRVCPFTASRLHGFTASRLQITSPGLYGIPETVSTPLSKTPRQVTGIFLYLHLKNTRLLFHSELFTRTFYRIAHISYIKVACHRRAAYCLWRHCLWIAAALSQRDGVRRARGARRRAR